MRFLPAPRLFISYSRRDAEIVQSLVLQLQRQKFRVFLDTADIDPGDNFVTRLSQELEKATVVVGVISEAYCASRWAQAELYHAIALRKIIAPLVLTPDAVSGLDDPLQRLLRDVQFVTAGNDGLGLAGEMQFAEVLSRARRRYQWEVFKRTAPLVSILLILGCLVWWGVTHLNELAEAKTRAEVVAEVLQADGVLQRERLSALARRVTGDKQVISELFAVSLDPARKDAARLNAIALSSDLLKGRKAYRWYIRQLNVSRLDLADVSFVNTSFLGGSWSDVRIKDSTFAGVAWTAENAVRLSNVIFDGTQFFGGEMQAIVAVDVTFRNTKFRGTHVDTTNFSKVRFLTAEEQKTEGTPLITPIFALFERSVVISNRTPSEANVMDLTQVGDDVVFDNVVFVESRLEGWFRPEWFRNSSFERCDLPPSLTKQALERAGNTVN